MEMAPFLPPSLRSKRFSKAFRTFDALFAFLAAEKLGRAQKSAHFSALTPIFPRLKNKKCLERAENLTETLAMQATFLQAESMIG